MLAIVLSVPTFHASYAETATADTPAAAGGRGAAARLRRQDADELLAQFRRYRLDADLDGHRADDDHPRPGLVLRRHGAQEERRRHGDDELRHHLPRQHSLAVLHLQSRLPRRDAVHRRARSRVPARHRQRHRQGHRQSQSAGADDPRDRLLDVPADLRDHHRGADRRFVRGAHEVLGHALVHRPVGDLRLFADRALGLGTGRHLQLHQRRGLVQGARFRRRHRGARQFGHRRPDGGAHARQAQGHRAAAQHGLHHDRRLAAVGRLVRLQRRLRRDPPACRPAWQCWSPTSPPRRPASPG